MPRYIIKPVRDEDFYVEWSTVVDAPVEYGTRHEFIDEGYEAARLDRADKHGTSSLWSYKGEEGVTRRPCDYSHDEILMAEGFDHELTPEGHHPYVRREMLKAFLTYNHGSIYWDHTHPAIRWEPDDA